MAPRCWPSDYWRVRLSVARPRVKAPPLVGARVETRHRFNSPPRRASPAITFSPSNRVKTRRLLAFLLLAGAFSPFHTRKRFVFQWARGEKIRFTSPVLLCTAGNWPLIAPDFSLADAYFRHPLTFVDSKSEAFSRVRRSPVEQEKIC